MNLPILTPQQIEQISHIIGATDNGFTGSEIGHALAQCGMEDPDPGMTKWKRLHNAFAKAINGKTIDPVYKFIQFCMEPSQGLKSPDRYSWMRTELNKVLMLSGIAIRDDGKFHHIEKAETLSEVQRRTKSLNDKLYGAHHYVLNCCTAELLAEDYFHAVQEAAKSLGERVREMSGLTADGTDLFQKAFAVKKPYIAMSALETNTEQNIQNGLKEMLCGVYHMVRNVTAHEMKIRWDINERDAIDILMQISYLHKILDNCFTVPR